MALALAGVGQGNPTASEEDKKVLSSYLHWRISLASCRRGSKIRGRYSRSQTKRDEEKKQHSFEDWSMFLQPSKAVCRALVCLPLLAHVPFS